MTDDIPQLTLEVFDQLDWQSVPDEATDRECSPYSRLFYRRAGAAHEAGRVLEREAYVLLGHATGLRLESEQTFEPFVAGIQLGAGRSSAIDDISEADCAVLRELAPTTTDPELRARLADVAWVRVRDYESARLAVESYLASAAHLDGRGNWLRAKERIERAMNLSASLRAGGRDLFERVVDHIEQLLAKHDWNLPDRCYQPAHLMPLLIQAGAGDPIRWELLAKLLAEAAEDVRSWERAAQYWEIKADWAHRREDEDAARDAKIRAAETSVKLAADYLAAPEPNFMSAAIHLRTAYEAMRQLKNSVRAEELRLDMLSCQERAMEQMHRSKFEIDVSRAVDDTTATLKGLSFHDALRRFVLLASSPSVKVLRAAVEERSDSQLLIDLLSTSERVDSRGRVVGRRPNRNTKDPTAVEAAILCDMFDRAIMYQRVQVAAIVDPGRAQINLEHRIRFADFLPLMAASPFVPHGREAIYAVAFETAFQGRLIEACHLLVPQLENSIRHVIEQLGVSVYGMTGEGIQEALPLNRLLQMRAASDVFGEDVVFDLRGLLVEPFGSNLRNRLAHGLMSQGEFFDAPSRYLWWLTLKLCLLPILRNVPDSASGDLDHQSQGDSDSTN